MSNGNLFCYYVFVYMVEKPTDICFMLFYARLETFGQNMYDLTEVAPYTKNSAATCATAEFDYFILMILFKTEP